jgi:hypothetical protein
MKRSAARNAKGHDNYKNCHGRISINILPACGTQKERRSANNAFCSSPGSRNSKTQFARRA